MSPAAALTLGRRSDRNHLLYENRSQIRLQLGSGQDASMDIVEIPALRGTRAYVARRYAPKTSRQHRGMRGVVHRSNMDDAL